MHHSRMDPVLPRIGRATYPFFFHRTFRNGDADQDFGGLGIHGHVNGTPPVVVMSPSRWTMTPTITDVGSQASWSRSPRRMAATTTAADTHILRAPPREIRNAFVANATRASRSSADPAGMSPNMGTTASHPCRRAALLLLALVAFATK